MANVLLRADYACCTQQRRHLACRSYYCLMTCAYQTGNIVEACQIKWVVDRLESKAFAALSATVGKDEFVRQGSTLCTPQADVPDLLLFRMLLPMPDGFPVSHWQQSCLICRAAQGLSSALQWGSLKQAHWVELHSLPFASLHFYRGDLGIELSMQVYPDRFGRCQGSVMRIPKP